MLKNKLTTSLVMQSFEVAINVSYENLMLVESDLISSLSQ